VIQIHAELITIDYPKVIDPATDKQNSNQWGQTLLIFDKSPQDEARSLPNLTGSINRTVRHEWLGMHSFESIEHAQLFATRWLWTCNNERPHTAIGGMPPRKLLEAA